MDMHYSKSNRAALTLTLSRRERGLSCSLFKGSAVNVWYVNVRMAAVRNADYFP
jgi:hypothetical protein